jgi:hypothetical protein
MVHDDAFAPEQDVKAGDSQIVGERMRVHAASFAPPRRQGGGPDSASTCGLLRALNTPAVR